MAEPQPPSPATAASAAPAVWQSVWQVPHDHPAFAGHFPGRPLVPGVLLLDQALQLAQQCLPAPITGWSVSQAKFVSPVGPGETLVLQLQGTAGGQWAFRIHSGTRLVATGSVAPLQEGAPHG